jgi:alpha/beta superfamily hydrolase
MQRSNSEEPVRIRSGPLSLEGRIALPPAATRAAIVCHPHPQYGGDMDNGVVVDTVRALGARGVATVRFNFRGVGESDGSYSGTFAEVEDARAAAAFVREQLPDASVALGGYSFGAMVALAAGHDHPDVERLFAIALPATMFDTSAIVPSTKPKLFMIGDRDQYCPYAALESLVASLAGENRLVKLAGADHFLAGFGVAVGDAVAEFVAR